MQVNPQVIPEVLLIEPNIFRDRRGPFLEIFQASRCPKFGIPSTFVQNNLSFSQKGVVRALHYQLRFPQGKLIIPMTGEIWDVVVDVRRGSPTFGKSMYLTLTADSGCQLYVPPGFAHGFASVTDQVTVLYKCTDFYYPEDEHGIIWNDPSLEIAWPVKNMVLSDKDREYPKLADLLPEQLPVFK